MKKTRRRLAFTILFITLFCAPPAFPEVVPIPLDAEAGPKWLESGVISETEYQDESIHVTVETDTFNGMRLTMIHVKIADPSQLRTAMSGSDYAQQRYVPFKLLDKQANAVVSVDGDFFKYNDFGYLVRQSVVYRERPDGKRDVLLIDNKGDFHGILQATSESIEAYLQTLEEGRFVVNSFTFGPLLARDGELVPQTSDLFQASIPQQRMAILQLDTLEYAIFHCEGKCDGSRGLTMHNFARAILLVYPHVKAAYNLDGGGSTYIAFLNKRLNQNDGARSICDILYFASACQP